METPSGDTVADLEAIYASRDEDIEKLVQAFDRITRSVIETARREIELARAMQDQETVVKQQIRMAGMKDARAIFQNCYLRITGKRSRLWEE